jgi:hypothetical protein
MIEANAARDDDVIAATAYQYIETLGPDVSERTENEILDAATKIAKEHGISGNDFTDTLVGYSFMYSHPKNTRDSLKKYFSKVAGDNVELRNETLDELLKVLPKQLPKKEETDAAGMEEGRNHLGEREYKTYDSWRAAVKKVDANATYDGDKDICQAFTADKKPIGQWEGDVGSIATHFDEAVIDEATQYQLTLDIVSVTQAHVNDVTDLADSLNLTYSPSGEALEKCVEDDGGVTSMTFTGTKAALIKFCDSEQISDGGDKALADLAKADITLKLKEEEVIESTGDAISKNGIVINIDFSDNEAIIFVPATLAKSVEEAIDAVNDAAKAEPKIFADMGPDYTLEDGQEYEMEGQAGWNLFYSKQEDEELDEALFTDGAAYAFVGEFGYRLNYNENGRNGPDDFLKFIREHINNEIPESIMSLNWGDIDPTDYDAHEKLTEEEQKAVQTLLNDAEEGDGDTWYIPDHSWDSRTEKAVETLEEHGVETNDLNEDEIEEYVWKNYFDGNSRALDDTVEKSKASYYDDYDRSEVEEHIEKLEKQFNEDKMEQYLKKEIPSILKVEFSGIDVGDNGGRYGITVTSSKKLSDEQKTKLTSELSGQMSDGWGEGAEQQDTGIQLADGYVDLSIDFSEPADKLKLTKEAPIPSDIKKFGKDVLASIHSTMKKYVKPRVDKARKAVANAIAPKESARPAWVPSIIEDASVSEFIATAQKAKVAKEAFFTFSGKKFQIAEAALTEEKGTALSQAADRLENVVQRLAGFVSRVDDSPMARQYARKIERCSDELSRLVEVFDRDTHENPADFKMKESVTEAVAKLDTKTAFHLKKLDIDGISKPSIESLLAAVSAGKSLTAQNKSVLKRLLPKLMQLATSANTSLLAKAGSEEPHLDTALLEKAYAKIGSYLDVTAEVAKKWVLDAANLDETSHGKILSKLTEKGFEHFSDGDYGAVFLTDDDAENFGGELSSSFVLPELTDVQALAKEVGLGSVEVQELAKAEYHQLLNAE